MVQLSRWLACAAGLLMISGTARAVSVSVSPARIFASGPAGVSGEVELAIFNGSADTLSFELIAHDLGLDADGSDSIRPPATTPWSAVSWLTFHPQRITVAPKSSAKVRTVISVPPDAHGGHYAVLMVRTIIPKDGKEGFAVAVGAQMAVKLYHAVTGRSSPKLVLLERNVRPPTTHEKMEVALELANGGDVHTKLRGDLAILDRDNKLVGRTAVDEGPILLPGGKAKMKFEWGGELPVGTYNCIVTVGGTESLTPFVVDFPITVGGAAGGRKGA